MKTDVLDVLLYIFERFQEDDVVPVDKAHTLVEELEDVGFTSGEIDGALAWLDGLVDTRSEDFVPVVSKPNAFRIFNEYEKLVFNTESQGFIHFIEQAGVLDSHSREAVIDRVMALGYEDPIELEQLKWVIMMVLFNLPGQESAFAWMENLEERMH